MTLETEIVSSSSFPVELIVNEEKRKEFLVDFERLSKRCGYNAMSATFTFYLLEQKIEKEDRFAPEYVSLPSLSSCFSASAIALNTEPGTKK